jgi:hypothetical protein
VQSQAQPLASVCPSAKPDFSLSALVLRPEHAAIIAQCIATWAKIEADLGELVVQLSVSSAVPAMAMYSALNNFQSQSSVLDALVETRVEQPYLDIYKATMIVIRRSSRPRHSFAHCVWGYANELPEHVLLVNPRDLWNFNAEQQQDIMDNHSTIDIIEWQRKRLDMRKIAAYSLGDLLDIKLRLGKASLHAFCLKHMLLFRESGTDKWQSRLCSDPEIQITLSKMQPIRPGSQEALPPPRQTSDVY